MSISATIIGDVAVQRRLLAMGEAASGQAAQRALVAGSLLVLNEWKAISPYRTGTYRRSLHPLSESPTEVRVGTDLVYARRLEYGFSGTDSLGRTYNQPPGGYARRAADTQRDAAIREIGAAFADLLRAAVA